MGYFKAMITTVAFFTGMLNSTIRNLFISYAREDRPIAETLHAYLKPLIAQGKLRVFIDTEEIEKGEEWHKKITDQLHHADAFLFLVSQHFFRSNYVIETELPAMIKRYREENVECWPFLVSDYPWDDFIIDGFNLAGIQAIGPFDNNKGLIPLNALQPPDQDSQFRRVYTEVREWIEKLEREERQKQEALTKQQEQKEREEKHRLEQEEEQRKQRERQESERKRREQEKHTQASAVKSEARKTDTPLSEPSPTKSDSAKATSAFPFKYLWLVIVGLVAVVLIFQFVIEREPEYPVGPSTVNERTRVEAERKAREEAEAEDRARAAAEAESQRQAERGAELIALAERQIRVDRLTYPPGDNALELIRQAQEIQPNNARASELVVAILDRYLQLAQGAIIKKEFDKGQQYLDKARRVDADSSRLAEIQKELDSVRRQRPPVITQQALDSFRDTLSSGGKGPEMVQIPAGSFMMGSSKSEADRDNDEGPQHKVHVRSFALGKKEVTFEEYDLFTVATGREKPNDGGWGRESRPVINVSWEDAVAYAEWLSGETGKHYRLPSEAEWEYAARAGTTTNYSWGDDIRQDNKVWANCDGCGSRWGGKQTAPVGSFEANTFGLYDMAGNVYEWTQDCWHKDYQNAPSDGSAWLESEQGNCGRRVIRGGSWGIIPRYLRSATRIRNAPDVRNNDLGFRLAQDP